ncbi:MAG TPA: hypothetical protein VM328_06040 [Fimbriimonadaceae bacterium]|nr:hypothetical protein [Fimbriimonadaceae bacterium]
MDNHANIDLETRLRRLERTNRRWMIACGALALLPIVAFGCGSREPRAYEVLRARKFELVDPSGQSRGLLFFDKEGAVLSLDDSEGKVRIALAASQARPTIELFDETSQRRLALTAEREGSTLEIYDEAGQLRGTIGQYKDDHWLAFQDRQGRVSYSVPPEESPSP